MEKLSKHLMMWNFGTYFVFKNTKQLNVGQIIYFCVLHHLH